MSEHAVVRRRAPPSSRMRATPRSVGPRPEVRAILGGARIQRAVTVGAPDDMHEQEAAAMSARVGSQRAEPERELPTEVGPRVQRQPAAEASAGPAAAAPAAPATAEALPADMTQEELATLASVQRAPLTTAPPATELQPDLASRIAAPGEGRPLPPRVADAVQPWLPYDFSKVRIHDSPQAQRDAAALRARAFTFGHNIWLGAGEAIGDLRLMAHELTHVAQQGAAQWRPAAGPGTAAGVAATTATPRVQRELAVPDFILKPVREKAATIPGFELLCVMLGRNPITDEQVAPTAHNIAHALLSLAGREDILTDLESSGALQKAVEVITAAWQRLGFTWAYIRGVIDRVWSAVTSSLNPFSVIDRALDVLVEPVGRVVTFAKTSVVAVLEVIFDAVMSALGPRAQRISALLRRTREVFTGIINDPVGFVGHLMDALGQGFRQFGEHILQHLGQGLIDWLTGALASAGVQLPEKWDFRGVLSLVLQVLGISYSSIRAKLVKVIGEKPVAIVEKALPFLLTLFREGPAAAWQQLLEYIGSLRDQVIDGIRDYIRSTVVSQAIQWVLGLLTPAGVVIKAIQAIYRAINFVLDQADRLVALVDTVVESLAKIQAGQIADAANAVEGTLARFVPVVIDLLARLLGLGDIPERIKKLIGGLRERVDKAIDRLIAWIVEKAKALIAKAKSAIQDAVAWWKARRGFEVEGEKHAVYVEGEDSDADLIIESSPRKLSAFLSDNRPDASDMALAAAHAAAEAAVAAVRTRLSDARAAKRKGDKEPAEYAQAMDTLRDALRELVRVHTMRKNVPPTPLPDYGPLRNDLATSMTVAPLTKVGPEGTAPSSESDIWKLVKKRAEGNRTFYVRGHLLNQKLHGSGSEPRNLSPISQAANQEHESKIEDAVKERVLKEGKIAKYTVTLAYGQHSRNRSSLDAQLEASNLTKDRKQRVREVLDAEEKLPSGLTGRAVELKANAQNEWVEEPTPFVPDKSIDLDIAKDLTGIKVD